MFSGFHNNTLHNLEEIQDRLSALKEERNAAKNYLNEAQVENAGKMSKEETLEALASLDTIIESRDAEGLYNLVHNLIEKVIVLNGDVTIHWAFC